MEIFIAALKLCKQKCEYDPRISICLGIMGSVFANGLGDLSSIPGWVMPKTQKIVLHASLLNTQHHKAWSKG